MPSAIQIRRGAAALLVAGGLALAAAGCGSDEETTDTAPIAPETATATGETTTTEQTETTETPETTTEETETETDDSGGVGPPETETETTDDGGGVAPGYDPGQPDSEANDVPPEPGTPQEQFEQYCAQHPDACG